MIFIFNRAYIESASIPEQLQEYLFIKNNVLIIQGHRAGKISLLVATDSERVIVSDDFNNFGGILKENNFQVEAEPLMIAHLMQNALCPTPYTAIRNVYMLTFGDTIEIPINNNPDKTISTSYSCPFLSIKSLQNENPDTARLRRLIAESINKQMKNQDESILMLSSGKDSTALLLGMADNGFSRIKTLTYVAGTSNDEDDYAAPLSKKFGIKHQVIKLPDDNKIVKQAMTEFFENNLFPSLDNTQVPYVLTLFAAETKGGQVFDGTGNDSYMGYCPNKRDRTKYKYNISALGARSLSAFFECTSMVHFFLKSRTETGFPGYYITPSIQYELFESDSQPVIDYWQNSDKANSNLNISDFRIATKLRHYDSNQVMLKGKTGSASFGSEATFPWADENIADYYFNLPEGDRFDSKSGTNKLLLRKMLKEAIDYPDQELGKRYFEFQLGAFLLQNRAFVESEIFSCPLWKEATQPTIKKWFDGLKTNSRFAFGIHALFMISGWHNHSKFLN